MHLPKEPATDGEAARLAALHSYQVVDTPTEPEFDGIAAIAARICDTPMAMVTFIDQSHQSIKARFGIDLSSTLREDSFCTHVIGSTGPMTVEDTAADARFRSIPLVTGSAQVRFYAGAPIRTTDGFGLGAVCVLDTKPRQLDRHQLLALEALADDAIARLELRRTAKALAESERLHRRLFDESPQPMVLFDTETLQMLQVNDAAVELYHWPRETMLAMTVRDFWLPDDLAENERRMATDLARAASRDSARHRQGDGGVLIADVARREFHVGDRRCMLVLVTDITVREHVTAELIETREHVAAAQRLAHVGNFTVDMTTGTVVASDELRAILGARRSAPMDWRMFRDCVHPDDLGRLMAQLEAAVGGGPPLDVEHRVIRHDGAERWFLTRGTLRGGTRGGRRVFAGTAQDITEHRQDESRLREQAALIDAAHDAIVVRDLDHRILSWNHGASEMFGWSPDEAIGQNDMTLRHRDTAAYQRATDAVLANGQWSGELRKHSNSGAEVIVDGSWTLLRHRDGRPKAVLTISTDITEKRRLELQYLRADRMQSIGTLAGGIAHDLNNMLTPILMSIQLLRMSAQGPQADDLLKTIEESTKRGSDLVKQVLTFARGVDGAREDLMVDDIVRDVAKLARDTFPPTVQIDVATDPRLWLVTGDRTQIHQVLLNLAVNARDAMPEGGQLSFSVENVMVDQQYAAMSPGATAGSYVLLNVTDTGTGMPEEVRDRAFEPFFTTKPIGTGTGLGLATAQAIVTSHGGFVRVYSELGHGTTFKVYLPARESAGVGAAGKDVDALPVGRGQLILVVDDEAAIRSITQQTLEAFGYQVVVASDGVEALALFGRLRDRVDLILTDVMMPAMDGPALIRAVRHLDPNVRIIGSSGLAGDSDLDRVAGMGVDQFISKPYSADALLRVIREVLEPGK